MENTRINNAIISTRKIINELGKINTNTISRNAFNKLQRKYIRLETQYELANKNQDRSNIENPTTEISVRIIDGDPATELIEQTQGLIEDLYHIKIEGQLENVQLKSEAANLKMKIKELNESCTLERIRKLTESNIQLRKRNDDLQKILKEKLEEIEQLKEKIKIRNIQIPRQKRQKNIQEDMPTTDDMQ